MFGFAELHSWPTLTYIKLDYDGFKRGKSLLAVLQALLVYIEMSRILCAAGSGGPRSTSLSHSCN